MDVSLTPELEQFVSREGPKRGVSNIQRSDELDSLCRDVRQGFADIEQGRYTEYDRNTIGELVERVKARGRQRLAAERQMNPAE